MGMVCGRYSCAAGGLCVTDDTRKVEGERRLEMDRGVPRESERKGVSVVLLSWLADVEKR